MPATTMMMNAFEGSYVTFARELVETLSSSYGFDPEEAMNKLNLTVRVEREEKRKPKAVKIQVPGIPLPFCNKVIDGCCQGIRPNHGLFTQCTQKPQKNGIYCKTCNKHAEENESNKPSNGNINDRVDKEDWRSPDGKSPANYTKIMKKFNITREKAEEEASKMGWTIAEKEFEEQKKKAGRPKSAATSDTDDEKPKRKRGRPAKKEKKTIVKQTNMGDSVIAEIMSKLNLDDDTSSETSTSNDGQEETKDGELDEDTSTDDELSSQPDMMDAVISEPEEIPDCEEFEFNGVKFYKDKKSNELYEHGDPEEELALVGIFNQEKQCIEPVE
tara:strand:- start:829 stop:1818 length:990 start_codon:yes stop_codon:yes gene_type:complete